MVSHGDLPVVSAILTASIISQKSILEVNAGGLCVMGVECKAACALHAIGPCGGSGAAVQLPPQRKK